MFDHSRQKAVQVIANSDIGQEPRAPCEGVKFHELHKFLYVSLGLLACSIWCIATIYCIIYFAVQMCGLHGYIFGWDLGPHLYIPHNPEL